ncbi:SRPBCC family protein [Cellulosimicrobium composti]|uniref:SRPBCC family protein n=1 Tax=Cellulosimicrobium composti TaxID=2672572 RepID=A0ABX0BCW3_9MICO|nr:SRPBCC family protein [Cellulosimicrobium composti]NDO89155.1 SRPBCC family protein [Cellulosimicrobium composti]
MTTTGTHETEIVVPTDLPIVRIVREFDAPVAKVFRAHVDPDLFARWNGPRNLTQRTEHWDVRTGGAYRYVHVDPDGNEYAFFGSVHEVRPDELIVQTFTYEGFPDGVSLDRLQFEELPGGRCRLTATSLVDSFEGRDGFVSSGMEVGIREGYEQLDEILAES